MSYTVLHVHMLTSDLLQVVYSKKYSNIVELYMCGAQTCTKCNLICMTIPLWCQGRGKAAIVNSPQLMLAVHGSICSGILVYVLNMHSCRP